MKSGNPWKYAFVVLAALVLVGCTGGEDEAREFSEGDIKPADEHHHGEGDHGGEIVEIGEEEFHAEVVFDEDNDKFVVYFLDGSMEKAVPVEAAELTVEVTVDGETTSHTLAAAPLEGEEEGTASRFELTDAGEFIETFHDNEGAKGTFKVTLGGKEFPVEFEHHHEE